MSIDNILKRRDSKESSALLKRIADQKPSVTVTPTIAWPSDAEVTVKNPVKSVEVENFGDVLRSLALLGKGVSQLNASVSGIKLDIPDKNVQEVSGYVETNVSTAELEKQTVEVAKAIKALSKEIKAIPKESKVEPVKIEIPKSFKIDNFDELKRGFVSINDNIVKLADVVRDSNQVVEAAEQDDSAVIGAVERVENAIKGIVFPIPQGSTPSFKNTAGEAVSATVQARGSVSAASVQLVDGSGNQVTSFGGGTQYTEGDTDASITGTVSMWEDAANTVVAASATKPFPVEIIAGAGSGGTAAADDADFTAGTTSGTPAMGVYESTPTSVTDGDLGTIGITVNREVKVSNAGLTELAAAINSSKIDVNIASDGVGIGGGTQYTEDAAAAANPVGTSMILVREDARAGSLTTTDGDNVAARGNNKGELYVKTTDSDAILTTIDADTGNISTKIDTVAGAVSGTEMQVDVLTMPTVTVASHAVTNAGTFAVQVDGAALTSLQLADDVVATLGTTTYTEAATKGTTIGAVRRDADTTLVDTTNEIGPLQMDANGRLKVEVFSGETLPVSGTVTADLGATDNAVLDAIAASVAAIDTDATTIIGHVDGIETVLGTIDADTGNIATSVALIDDTVTTLGTDTYTEATSKGLTIGAVRRDADTTLVNTTNEFTPLQVDANGRLKVEAFSGETLPVSGTVTADLGATDNAVLDAIAASVAAIDTDTSTIITNTGATTTALQIMDDWDNAASDGASVSGDVAHDTADAGEPVKIGGKAIDLGANPTEVTANDRTNGYFTRAGQLFTIGGHPNIISKNYTVSDADGAQTDAAIVTVAAGTAIVVTSYEVTADNANTGDCACRIGFGATNTPALDAAGVIMNHTGIAPGSGVVRGDGSGILGIGASNEDLRCTTEDPAGGNLSITVTYYTILIG